METKPALKGRRIQRPCRGAIRVAEDPVAYATG